MQLRELELMAVAKQVADVQWMPYFSKVLWNAPVEESKERREWVL